MPSHSSGEPVLQRVLWRDAQLESVLADYDAVHLRVREDTGRELLVHCEGYTGYGVCGFWDETLIDRVELSEQHPAIERCVKRITARPGLLHLEDSGNEQRNTRRWKVLSLYLGDGCCLEVVAAAFTVEP